MVFIGTGNTLIFFGAIGSRFHYPTGLRNRPFWTKSGKFFVSDFNVIILNLSGIKIRSQSYTSFCSMTDTFRVNAKTVDFRALSAKYPQNGTFFTTTRKLSIVNQNEVYGCDRILFRKD